MSACSYRPSRWLLGIGLLLVAAACDRSTAGRATESTQANVVFFLSDALRAANLPMYGYPRATAPRLAEMVQEGIVFENHFAHYPGTPISVSQLMTGRLMAPLLVGYKYLAVPLHDYPERALVLPRAFAEQGYRTGMVSSHYWFEDSKRLTSAFESSSIVSDPQGSKSYAEYDKLFAPVAKYLAAAEDDRRPFLLYIHSMDTHGPNEFHPGFEAFRDARDWPEEYNRYDSEIAFTDHWVGKVLDELRRLALLDRTIVVFTADHGEDFGEMGPEPWNHNHGLLVRRSQTHVPLLIRLPGGKHGGMRFSGITQHIDLAPTLLRWSSSGAELGRYDVDGVDLSTRIEGGAPSGEEGRTGIVFSSRYWGIVGPQDEVYYDTWEKTHSPLLRVVTDARNYPRLESVNDPARREVLVRALDAERTRQLGRLAALPLLPPEELPAHIQLSILLDVTPSSEGRPTFEDRLDDDRWSLPGPYLRAAPGELPKPLELSTPWIPGMYRISLVLDHRVSEFRQELDVSFPAPGDSASVHVRAEGPRSRRLGLGVHRLGNPFVLRLANPVGGVSIAGLEIVRESDRHEPEPVDPATKERLRQLGYQ